jgi:hypothetical protein
MKTNAAWLALYGGILLGFVALAGILYLLGVRFDGNDIAIFAALFSVIFSSLAAVEESQRKRAKGNMACSVAKSLK